MEIRYLRYTAKELSRIIEYYIGTPKIYKYCYENSEEFKNFIDNATEIRKKKIKTLHTAYHCAHCREPLVHLATFGLSFGGKKLAEKKEFKELDETIKGDEFKTLFSKFDEVLEYNGIEWCNE